MSERAPTIRVKLSDLLWGKGKAIRSDFFKARVIRWEMREQI
jgi:hypothetical protein